MNRVDVAIIGAGPNGLSLALHLAASSTKFSIFGHPMAFWSKIAKAAQGRYLKSFCFGTNVYSPQPGTRFADWSRSRGLETFEPCSMSRFAEYGMWLQKNYLPGIVEASVVNLSMDENGFLLRLENGEEHHAKRVVVATGLSSFEYIPPILERISSPLLVHSNSVDNFSAFRGKKVGVVGAGQSALEAVALLHESGAAVELIVREPSVTWMKRLEANRPFLRRIRRPISSLGVGIKSWILVHFPGAFHHFPERRRIDFVCRHMPPEGAWWLRERCEAAGQPTLKGNVVNARMRGDQAELCISIDGATPAWRCFDRVIAATGFKVDITRLTFIDGRIRDAVKRTGTSPKLDRNFQSSVDGLYFIGPTAAFSHGPLFRFVAGGEYAAPTVATHIRKALAGRNAPMKYLVPSLEGYSGETDNSSSI